MIKGTLFPDRLNVLLLFGDNTNLFEEKLITGFIDNDIIQVDENSYLKEKIAVYTKPYGGEDKNDIEPGCLYYLKNEFIEFAIEVETGRSLSHLRKNYYEIEDYSRHQWIFARILKCYLSAFSVNKIDYPYTSVFIECFSDIAKESILLYEGVFGNQFNLKDVKVKLSSDLLINRTGYKLKSLIYNTKINLFINQLISNNFIDSKDREKFKRFLQGEIIAEKIDWKRELRYLVYFIKKLNEKKFKNPTYLLSPPGQKWKCLYSIFSYLHSDLPDKFDITYSKLGKKYQKEIDSLFDSLSL